MLDYRSRYPTIQEAFEVWKNRIVSLGFGYPLGVDLPGESRGYIPNSESYDNVYRNRWSSANIISIAIGQGEIDATPLQMCNLAAIIANRGYYVVPHVVREIQDMPLDEQYRTKKDTGIDQAYFENVVEGMRAAVTGGTCTGLNLWGLDVCGKTGTVQNPHGRNHSACIAFAPMNDPKIAIVVYVESGGSGSTVAVPIARLMLEKFFYGEIPEWRKWDEERMARSSTLPGSTDFLPRIVIGEN
jgi:penicillin-binding protein 2